jgi:hypothetical protein
VTIETTQARTLAGIRRTARSGSRFPLAATGGEIGIFKNLGAVALALDT